MVRYCAMMNCANSDKQTLCHRFPKREAHFKRWQEATDKMHMADQELYDRHVVCTMHFVQTDYKHEQSRALNSTAVPKQAYYWKTPLYDTPTAIKNTTGNMEPMERCEYGLQMVADEEPEGEPPTEEMPEEPEQEQEELEDSRELTDETDDQSESNATDEDEAQESEDASEDAEYEQLAPQEEPVVVTMPPQNCVQLLQQTYAPGPITIVFDGFRNYTDNVGIVPVSHVNPVPVTVPSTVTTVADASMQTVPDEDTLQEQIIEEFYPTYAGRSRLTLIKQIVNTQKELLAALTTIQKLSTTLALRS